MVDLTFFARSRSMLKTRALTIPDQSLKQPPRSKGCGWLGGDPGMPSHRQMDMERGWTATPADRMNFGRRSFEAWRGRAGRSGRERAF